MIRDIKSRFLGLWSPRCTSMRGCQFKLLLPTVIMLLVVALLGLLVIVQFTTRQNRQAENDSRHMVRAILQERQFSLEKQVMNYAVWDDLYANVFERHDMDWLETNVWSYFRDAHKAAFVAILGPGDVRVAAFAASGNDDAWSRIEESALDLVQQIRAKPVPEPISTFHRVGDLTCMMVVAPIMPRLARAQGVQGMLVMTRPLTDQDMADIGRLYDLPKLSLSHTLPAKGSGLSFIRLASGKDGRSYLIWQAPSPGHDTLFLLLPGLLVLILLFFFMAQHMLRVWTETVGMAQGRENELNAVFSAAADAILIVSVGGDVLRANASAEAMFGMDFMRSEKGVMVDDVLHVRIGQGGIGSLWSFLRLASDRSAVSGLEATGRRGEETFPVEISAGLARLHGGEGMVLMVRDITERKRAEAEILEGRRLAEAASEAKSAFLANMSHDFRTPLNAMIGFSDIIRNQMFGPVGSEKYQDYAADIHSSASRLLHVIQNILEMSELESGRVTVREDMFVPRQVVEEVVDSFSAMASERHVSVVVEGDGPHMLVADRGKFAGVVSNLLDNAIRYTPGDRFVKVRLEEAKNDFGLLIEDGGPGLDEETRLYLFEPFFRSAHTYSQRRGAGLGLAICRKYAELMGGEISLEWTSGSGTCFRLRLPAGQVPAFFPEPSAK